MVERLTDEERKIIIDNWDAIKNLLLEKPYAEIKTDNFEIKAKNEKENNRIKLSIIKDDIEIVKIQVSEDAKLINFKLYSDEKEIEKKELIYTSSSILYFIKKYKMQHPIFKKNENDNILDKSVTEDNVDEIFYNPDINEIIDDHFDSYISKDIFKIFKNNKNYYDDFSLKEYSELLKLITKKSRQIIGSPERKNFENFIVNINLKKEKIIILAGAQKIGITFSILQIVDCNSYLYIDLNTIFKLKRQDKRKYLFTRFINLFRDYEEYYNFMNLNLLSVQGYNNILSIIEEIVPIIANKLNDITLIIDNYDDYLVGEKKLSSDYLDKLYSTIKNNDIKILFIGRGNFISNLLLDYFYNKSNIKEYILFKYYNTLNLDIENIIHSYYKENKINEIELYYNLRNNNMESTIINLITIKNLKNIIGKNFRNEFPFQFFHLSLDENENIKIEHQFNDLINLNNLKIREYLAKINYNILFYKKVIPSIKGFIFEELVISILMNNKSSFKNLNFSPENIIEVESIYDMKDINTITTLKDGPILIIQITNGQTFDFGIITKDNNLDFFIGGQIGLNKTNEDLCSYQEKISEAHDNILSNLKKLTGRDITELKFLLILNKEWQESLQQKYDEIFQEIDKYKKKKDIKTKTIIYEDEDNKKNLKKLSLFNSKYGIKCCENWKISYLLFSDTDLCFYKDDKKIESFDIKKIKSFKTGFELFCIQEYFLIPYTGSEQILTDKEKSKFIEKLKEMDPDIKDIKINYKINGKVNIMAVTPENYGIISIYNDIKIFTYFTQKINIFIIKDEKVMKYQNFDKIHNYPFENNEFLERYFCELVYEDEDEDEDKDENNNNDLKDENKESEKESGILIEEENEQNKKKEKNNILTGNKRKHRKEQQKKDIYKNHIKYLQNKREHDDEDNDNN